MVQKVELAHPKHVETYGNPAPLGLLGLAVGCAALTPLGFGYSATPDGFRTAAVFALLFGAGCQLLAGYMELANRNAFGGAIFTLFSFNWMVNAYELYGFSVGQVPDHGIKLAVDVALLAILAPLTFGFGFFSKLLFAFLVDIDLLYVCKIAVALTGTKALVLPIALLTVGLLLIAGWLGLAALINPVAGRQVFRVAGPMFQAPKGGAQRFDWSARHTIFDVLYAHWREHAFTELSLVDLKLQVEQRIGKRDFVPDLVPDLFYLWEFGYVALTQEGDAVRSVRLNAQGIDLYEQVVLHKYDV